MAVAWGWAEAAAFADPVSVIYQHTLRWYAYSNVDHSFHWELNGCRGCASFSTALKLLFQLDPSMSMYVTGGRMTYPWLADILSADPNCHSCINHHTLHRAKGLRVNAARIAGKRMAEYWS
jgi:hypothetical protein